jgi:hypothetical protein
MKPMSMKDQDLIRIYETECGGEFAAADDFVKTLVPATINYNGEKLFHFSEHYRAREKLFAYTNSANQYEFKYFTQTDAIALGK